jgi:hypothetical protein
LKTFSRLIEEKVEPNDGIMEWMTLGPIDTEYLRAMGSVLNIGDVVLRELLTQV